MGVNRYQAMSAFIKSIRLRREEESVFWLTQLNKVTNPYHIIRRVVLCAAEDNMSIPVMEKALEFHKQYKQAELIHVAAEVMRNVRIPNWWSQESGSDYMRLYWEADNRKEVKGMAFTDRLGLLSNAVENDDMATAFLAFSNISGSPGFNAYKVMSTLASLSDEFDRSGQARATMDIVLQLKVLLKKDDNYTGQALYRFFKPLGDQGIKPVWRSEVVTLLDKVMSMTVNKCPSYYLDGVHVHGKDIRFGGVIQSMWGMCRAYKKFGRLHPEDEWPDEFHTDKHPNFGG